MPPAEVRAHEAESEIAACAQAKIYDKLHVNTTMICHRLAALRLRWMKRTSLVHVRAYLFVFARAAALFSIKRRTDWDLLDHSLRHTYSLFSPCYLLLAQKPDPLKETAESPSVAMASGRAVFSNCRAEENDSIETMLSILARFVAWRFSTLCTRGLHTICANDKRVVLQVVVIDCDTCRCCQIAWLPFSRLSLHLLYIRRRCYSRV